MHNAAAVLTAAAFLTGWAIASPSLHARLIPLLGRLVLAHLALGDLLAALAVAALLLPAPRRSALVREWPVAFFLGAAVLASGIVLASPLPAAARSLMLPWHGVFAFTFVAWIIAHAFLRLGRWRARPLPMEPTIDRRSFLVWLGAGAATAFGLPALAAAVRVGSSMGPAYAVAGSLPGFYVYSATGSIPHLDRDAWRLTVTGACQNPGTLSWSDLLAFPQAEVTADFQCATGWVVPQVRWRGVRIADLIAWAEPTPRRATWRSSRPTVAMPMGSAWLRRARLRCFWPLTPTANRCLWPTAPRPGSWYRGCTDTNRSNGCPSSSFFQAR